MWLLILVIIIGVIYANSKSTEVLEKYKNEKIDLYGNKGYTLIADNFFVNYKGGIKNLSVNSCVVVDLLQEGISFSEGKKIILFKNIEDISLKNEIQIQQQISLGKMLVFGGLALAMERKNKEVNNEYIVLKVEDEDGEYNVLLQSNNQKDNQKNYDRLIDLKNK